MMDTAHLYIRVSTMLWYDTLTNLCSLNACTHTHTHTQPSVCELAVVCDWLQTVSRVSISELNEWNLTSQPG